MASYAEIVQQYLDAKAAFIEMVPVKILPACPVNGIPVFSIDLSPEAAQQLAKVRDLDGQLKEIDKAFGIRSDPQTGNYAALQ